MQPDASPDLSRLRWSVPCADCSYLRGGREGRVRAQLSEYVRRNATLLALLREAYPDDFVLWERARRRVKPTTAHRSSVLQLSASVFEAHPQLPSDEPDCSSGPACTCSACCAAADGRARERTACLACLFSHPQCGGLGRQEPWKLPRTLAGAQCGVGPWCNTCEACCGAMWVQSSGASCEHCAAVECNHSHT